ncbi:MAG: hypothetical protein WC718_13615 [Phycisphaerales bacterium]|jgi:hypothetical protein
MKTISNLALALVAGSACLAHAADTYNFTVNSAASSATWSLSLNAPFQTSPAGTSFILGNYNATTNPTGTRTVPGIVGGDTNANTPVNISSGSVSASGNSGSTAIHPAGAFALSIDPAAHVAMISGLTANVLNGTSGSAGATLNLTYSTFRTRQPTCTLLGIPLSLPLGSASLETLTAAQGENGGVGTLMSTGTNTYSVNIPLSVEATATASYNGLPLDIPATTVPVVFMGTLTVNGSTATFNGGFSLSNTQSTLGPTALDPIPFTEPLCSGNLIVQVSLANTDTTVNASVTTQAAGTLVAPPCDPDVNQDGNADQGDVDYLLNVVAGGENPTGIDPDFNQDGNVDQGDVDALVNVIAGGACP